MLSRLLLSLFLLVSTASGAASRDPEQHFFDTSFGDFAEELDWASDDCKKGVRLMFESRDFVGNAMSQKDLALKSYRARATPVFAFFDLEGHLVTRLTGATGDSTEFRWLADDVVQERYKESTFAAYTRERQVAAGQ